MPATPKEAFDDILGMFKAAWDVETTAIVGSVPTVMYQTDNDDEFLNGDEPWCRVDVTHTQRHAATVSAPTGQRRYKCEGVASFQVYVPVIAGDDILSIAQDLARVITDAFENKQSSNGVEFFNVTAQESGRVDKWYLATVTLLFRYTEIR